MPKFIVTITIPGGASGDDITVEADDREAAGKAALALATSPELTEIESIRQTR